MDSSALVPLLLADKFRERMRLYSLTPRVLMISNLAQAEFTTTVGVRLREGRLDMTAARAALANLADLATQGVEIVAVQSADIDQAIIYLARLDLTLRAPDAIHIAAAARLGASLLTFDVKMIAAAQALGITVEAA